MDIKEVLSKVDHTILGVDSTWRQIKEVLDDAMEYEVASACIPASFVKRAKEYTGDKLSICTVIGFPNGYSTTESKVFEAKDAIENGADEVDMVINVGDLKDKRYSNIQLEISLIKAAVGTKILKVIIETALLTDEEKIKMCNLVTDAGADYIKTSTGFSAGGATFEDVKLFSDNLGDKVKIKAAGGITSIEDAETFINLGAERLGTSRIIKILKNERANGY
ncbi:MAG: deoxyribose-phosphate aldolase [Filifactoraceae bacterium]